MDMMPLLTVTLAIFGIIQHVVVLVFTFLVRILHALLRFSIGSSGDKASEPLCIQQKVTVLLAYRRNLFIGITWHQNIINIYHRPYLSLPAHSGYV